jgi:histidyl-tRNA synthetase
MVSLLKTRKFKVLSLPGDSMVMSSDNVPSRRSSSVVVVGGGRKVLVSDVAKIAVLGYAVSLDISSIEKIDAELASSTDIMQTFIPGCLSNNGESAYAVSLCRAAVFARIVSLMQGRTGVRSEVIEFLVDMLGADVVPNFSSPELAGSDLCAVVTGTGGSCYGNGTIMPSAAALSLNGLAPIELTAAEASTLKLGQFFATGCACLVASGAANIMLTIDSVAALSCDSFGANVEPFDSTHFDTHRQHRGQISSATNLRLLLEGSKRVNSPAMLTSPLASAFSSIPQVNGPAQDYFFSSVK